MTPEREKLIERVRKLMGMATSANENEAAIFAEKAQALVAEHSLTMQELHEAEKQDDLVLDKGLSTDSRPWRRQLGAQVAKMYLCAYFYEFKFNMTRKRKCGYIREDVHSFVGAPHNVVIAKIMFQYLTETIIKLASEGSKRASYRNSFQHAAANRLCWRIQEKIEDAKRGQLKKSDGTNLPALLDVYNGAEQKNAAFIKNELGTALVVKKSRGKSHDPQGMRDGDAAGHKIGLDVQLQQDNQKKLESKPR